MVDPGPWQLAARAPQLLRRLPDVGFWVELQRSTIETNTAVCTSLSDLRAEIHCLRELVAAAGRRRRCGGRQRDGPALERQGFPADVAGPIQPHAAGLPLAGRRAADVRPAGPRRRGGPGSSRSGCSSGSRPGCRRCWPCRPARRFGPGTTPATPAVRTMIWQRWPTAGGFGHVESAAEYDQLVKDLIASGVITDAKMAYFDVRPSSHVPTVELRVCDACPSVDDAVLIAGLFRAVVERGRGGRRSRRPARSGPREPMHRAAMWRAARQRPARGHCSARAPNPTPEPAAEVVRELVDRLRPQLEETGDWDDVAELTTATLARGGSSHAPAGALRRAGADHRRRRAAGGRDDAAESRRSSTGPAPRPATRDAPQDEANAVSGVPFPAYRPMLERLDQSGRRSWAPLRDRRTEAGPTELTFGVGGATTALPRRPRPAPRRRRTSGRCWRPGSPSARAPSRCSCVTCTGRHGSSQDGVVDPRVVRGCPGWRREASCCPPTSCGPR